MSAFAFFDSGGGAMELCEGGTRGTSTDALVDCDTDSAAVDYLLLPAAATTGVKFRGAVTFSQFFRKLQAGHTVHNPDPSLYVEVQLLSRRRSTADGSLGGERHKMSADSGVRSSDSVATAETMIGGGGGGGDDDGGGGGGQRQDSNVYGGEILNDDPVCFSISLSDPVSHSHRAERNGSCPIPARTAGPATTAAMNGGASVAPKIAFEMRGASSPVTPRCSKKPRRTTAVVFACTRAHLALATACLFATVLAAVVITYNFTKEGGERYQRHALANGAVTVARVGAAVTDNNRFDKLKSFSNSTSAATNLPNQLLLSESADRLSSVTTVGEPSAEELRLSEDLAPLWYNLSMKLYVPGFVPFSEKKNLTFNANLTLRFVVRRPTKTIELNALKLNLPTDSTAIHLTDGDATISAPKVIHVTINETLEKVFFKLDRNLTVDSEYLIRIPYSGPIAKKLSGLYVTQYTTRDGRQRFAAVTQMEPTDARRVVPCFDEPVFKAVWDLSITHPRGSRAVSNGIERREAALTDDGNWLETTFEPTLLMSSYLLAFVVSEFEYVEAYTNKNTRFRIWARKEAISFTSYALTAGIKVLEFYEDYYGIPFPLPKQDMMAFPDFAAGAMENWGLVTYREKYLLYGADLYTLQQKLAVASVVSHELAHQWFGNLVTMKWWSDLWLNEGFATLMEYLGTDAISGGDFRMDEYFMVESLDSAFDRDARATSHPLFFEINRAEDVSEAFDSITYSKGASLLRMIRAVMGEKNFKKGLNIYLNRYKYHNANYKNLWSTLTEAVPESLRGADGTRFDVSEFAQSWTEQMGYPVVEVCRTGNHKDGGIALRQERFKLDQSAQEKAKFREAKYGYKWSVPIWYNVNGEEKQLSWLTNDLTTTLTNVSSSDLLVVNSDSHGFYRVQYSVSTLELITAQLLANHNRISVKSRARIIDDTFKLAEAGRLPYTAALNLTRYLSKERDYLPWQMALNGLTVIQNYFGDEPEADYFRIYVKDLIGELFEKQISKISDSTFFDNDSKFFEKRYEIIVLTVTFSLLNLRIIQKVCSLRDQRCISNIVKLYRKKFAGSCSTNTTATLLMSSECSQVPVSLRSLTYCEGVNYGSDNDFDTVMSLYQQEAVQVERERLMMALACSRDTHTLKKLLTLASDVNSTVIRLQDKSSVFGAISSRIIGQKVVFDFFIDHWLQLYTDFKEQQPLLRSIIAHSIVGNSQRLIDEMEKFVQINAKTTKNLDIFKQRLEVIKTNRKWIEHNFRSLSEWFQRQQQNTKQKLN